MFPHRSVFLLAPLFCTTCISYRPSSSEGVRSADALIHAKDPVREGGRTSMIAIRSGIDRLTCARWSQEALQWEFAIFNNECDVSRATNADAFVWRVVQRSKAVLPLASAAYERFYKDVTPGHNKTAADAVARRSFWSDSIINRAILLSVSEALKEGRWQCDDCSVPARPERVEVVWEEFIPFLLAYIWPVQSVPNGPVELFVCGGINGAAELPKMELLRQTGFLVAAAFAEDEDTSAQIVQIMRQHNGTEGRSAAGLAREIQTFVMSPSGQSRACKAIADVEWFTSILVRGCAEPGVGRRDK